MNLYFRVFLVILKALCSKGLKGLLDPSVVRFRLLPNDLDFNGHMNNGRYHTIVDLMLIEYFVRSGYAQALVKAGWRPMAGGSFVSYRKGLEPFERYTLSFTLEAARRLF